jgi:ribosomal protein S18 acetylase RimI-like enzyme
MLNKTGLSNLEFLETEADDSESGRWIQEKLKQHIEPFFGSANRKGYLVVAKNTENSAIIGGLRGFSHWQWLYIMHLWVDDSARSNGIGERLLNLAETEAKKRSLKGIYVDTFDQRARAFYLRHGFEEFGRIDEFTENSGRFFLKKAV